MIYVIYVLIYIFVMLIIGQINFNQNIKTKFLLISSVLFNTFMGYVDIIIFKLISIYFLNIPSGLLGARTLAEIDFIFNMLIGVSASLMYLACLFPINMYMCDKSKLKTKLYVEISIISTIAGLLIYLIKQF